MFDYASAGAAGPVWDIDSCWESQRPTQLELVDPDNSEFLKRALAAYPSGVAAVAADVEGIPTVLITSSFMVGISFDPPMCSFAVQNKSSTWPLLAEAKTLGISVLSAKRSKHIRQMAGESRARRLTNVPTQRLESGAIVVDGSPLALECEITHTYPAGDHTIVVLEIRGVRRNSVASPVVYLHSRFHMTEPLAN